MKPAYFNEVDPFCCQWLRNLIAAGHLPAGDVDERSIADVSADDVRGYGQCHWFAGIGAWAYALRLAGWPDDRPVWTGSCPCQPFSVAGQRAGFDDERHLWPVWYKLIAERRPSVVFGEQVSGANALPWIDAVFDDMEATGYACGAVDFPACGVGAPHIRQRLYWVADCRVGNADRPECEARDVERFGGAARPERAAQSGASVGLADAECHERRQVSADAGGGGGGGGAQGLDERPLHGGAVNGFRLGDAGRAGLQGREREAVCGTGRREEGRAACEPGGPPGPVNGFWGAADWLWCRDGKHRPVEPGSRPLAHGIAARVGKLRAAGNAIVAPQAAEFVAAYLECRP